MNSLIAAGLLRPEPELDQAADGFGAAGIIILLISPRVDLR
jgi:hypothetical protein